MKSIVNFIRPAVSRSKSRPHSVRCAEPTDGKKHKSSVQVWNACVSEVILSFLYV